MIGVQAARVAHRRQHAMMQRQRRLDEPRHPRRRRQVADVRLDRADGDGPRRVALGEHGAVGLELDGVSGARAGAVRFEQIDARRRHLRHAIGPRQGALLAAAVGREQRGAASVRRAGAAGDDGVDAVAIAGRVAHAAQDDRAGALGRHEAVGVGIERARAGAGERAERGQRHVVFGEQIVGDGADDDGVELAADERADAEVQRHQRRGAGAVDRLGAAAEVVERGDARGALQARQVLERLLRRWRQLARQRRVHFAGDALDLGGGQLCFSKDAIDDAARARGQRLPLGLELGVAQRQVADDDADALGIPAAGAVAGVLERLRARFDGEHDRAIDATRRHRRQAQARRVGLDRRQQARDRRTHRARHARGGRVEEALRVPARRGDVANGVEPVIDAAPQLRGAGRAGHDRADADDGDAPVARRRHARRADARGPVVGARQHYVVDDGAEARRVDRGAACAAALERQRGRGDAEEAAGGAGEAERGHAAAQRQRRRARAVAVDGAERARLRLADDAEPGPLALDVIDAAGGEVRRGERLTGGAHHRRLRAAGDAAAAERRRGAPADDGADATRLRPRFGLAHEHQRHCRFAEQRAGAARLDAIAA